MLIDQWTVAMTSRYRSNQQVYIYSVFGQILFVDVYHLLEYTSPELNGFNAWQYEEEDGQMKMMIREAIIKEKR